MEEVNGSYFNYLKECYELDTKTINVSNFFAKKVESRVWIDGKDEVLNGSLPYLPIKDEDAHEIVENLSYYSKEKSLYSFAHFIVGRAHGNRVCAPVIFIPSEIIQEDGFSYAQLNQSQKFLNYNFLNTLKKEGSPPLEEMFDFLFKSPVIDFNVSARIADVLEEHFDDIDAEGIRFFPEFISEKKIKSKRPKQGFQAFAGMGLGLVRYSSKTLGIITELNELMNCDAYSGALTSVRSNVVIEDNEELKDTRVPSILSESQRKAIYNSLHYSKSIVVGPPGTGKSFTIANVAIDHILHEKSVLVVSKTDEAVDVVLEKLTDLGLGDAAMRPGKHTYAREMKKRIKLILMKSYRSGMETRTRAANAMSYDLAQAGKKLEKDFDEIIKKEFAWGERLYKIRNRKNLIAKLKSQYIKWKTKLGKPHWSISEDYYFNKEKLLSYHKKLAVFSYEEQLHRFLLMHRNHLSGFLKAISAYSLSKQELLFQTLDFSRLLRTFPIWLCKLSDLYEALPLQRDLFDLVIIDEASQVDLATVMPALQRAKKVMVVGDPNQLRHFSFVSRGQQEILKRKYNLGGLNPELLKYRDVSILDLCFEQSTSNDEVVFLDEHFRGNEELMAFSNKAFYGDQLKVIKSLPVHKYQSLWVDRCDGVRTEDGINEKEIDQVIARINAISKMASITNTKTSIGVLSPFRKQSERMVERIRTEIGSDTIKKHRIMIGTPYSFQGNERDEMIISWCVDEQTHPAAYRYLNSPEVFNVAVTRAKQRVMNIISFYPKSLSPDMLLADYLSVEQENGDIGEVAQEIHDQFLKEVCAWLDELSIEYICDYQVASIPMDILITAGKKTQAIDLIGFPGEFVDSIDLNQYMLLYRAGVSVFPLPYSYWHLHKDYAKEEFIKFHERRENNIK